MENYQQIFSQEPLFGRWLFNSVFVAICVTGFNLLFNSMAGYALAKFSFRKSIVVFSDFSGFNDSWTNHVDTHFLILKTLGWTHTRVWLCQILWMQRSYLWCDNFYKFPKELEEAAALDGLGSLQFFQIVLPLAKPALAAQTIFILWEHGITS